MRNQPIQEGQKFFVPTIETAAPRERRVSPAEVAADYTQLHEAATYLQVFQDLLKEAHQFGLNEEFIEGLRQDFLKTGSEMSLMQAIWTEESLREARKKERKELKQQLEAKVFGPQALTTAEELHPVDGSVINKMPFQSAFAYILLDKYIPAQEEALYALARELNFSGYAQTLFSPVLELVKSFNNAPVVYNLGSYIGQTEGTANFKYGYQMVLDRYETEKSHLRKDINNAENAKQQLTQIIKNVDANNSLTPTQKSKLKDMANGYIRTLDVCVTQMQELSSGLRGLAFIPGRDEYSPAYEIMGSSFSVVTLQNLEGKVVDGEINISSGETKGGLLNFFTYFLADVQNFGDLAQTNQLMLELQMRAMHQQWSLVTASLKLLHNVYRTLASS
ncbi:effector from type III secretion system family protein [Chlamydia suis]|uniref:CT620/CT621 family type III secretion system effector n=1 Tax=Chlamydia suis TaxID=83559 RepID=UPI0009B05CFD|nr:CT620/CT621 family type III secretion system effector [Chlamydia suis]MEB2681531.1 CT620/CT621 family type III secretion system effector [Chlamydia suis]MEB2681597.1 CT620/CT621 family type III secretion system effector [Chlamydia suis]MEB2682518.1 CT620/CT621 family type III secretion system effector [Chlamydia suis]MEB2684240.1 CT620/CT621 family type III secretion system effector [Chlamydia suis]MEB2684335.1 CT620/CT621 family type III secretion system effector [Chlamydia suis]